MITVHVGLAFYRNGRVYILALLEGDEALTTFINRLLLTGYYLLNLGYVLLTIRSWKTVSTWTEMLAGISQKTGKIMLILAVIHFCNMAAIWLIRRHQQHKLTSKT
jgi:hypothetical protein